MIDSMLIKNGLKDMFQSQMSNSLKIFTNLNFRKVKTTQEKQKQIVNYPDILAVHINRLIYNNWGQAQKINTLIKFPLKFKFTEGIGD